MKLKRSVAMLLAISMITLKCPISAGAEDVLPGENTMTVDSARESVGICICTEPCADEVYNLECSICGVENACLTDCAMRVKPAEEPSQIYTDAVSAEEPIKTEETVECTFDCLECGPENGGENEQSERKSPQAEISPAETIDTTESQNREENMKVEICVCTEPCTEETCNLECSICSAEDALLEDCRMRIQLSEKKDDPETPSTETITTEEIQNTDKISLDESTNGESIAFTTELIDVIASGNCGENVTWMLDDTGTLTISGTGSMYDYDSFGSNIPPWHGCNQAENVKNIIVENGVTYLGTACFFGCSNLISATIPESVTNIAYRMFYKCSNLISVTLPASSTSIGGEAFYKCTNLVSITLPDGIVSIGSSAFYECNMLTSIILPSGITKIEEGCFSFCSALEGISIPENVTSIGRYAFQGCSGLEKITIPANVTNIGLYSFSNCTSLKEITFLGNAPRFNSEVFTYVEATSYYPFGNSTWESTITSQYGGTIKWESYSIEDVDIEVQKTPPIVQGGETVTVTLALTGYIEGAEFIQALQIDVDNVDPSVLEVISHDTLLAGNSVIENCSVYQDTKNRLSLTYTQRNGAIPTPCENIYQFQFRINPDITEAGSITLPITVKMGTTSKTATVTTECVINYTVSDLGSEVVSVDIAWGSLHYTYSEGAWNAETHNYGEGSWNDNDSGYVTVTNTGTADTTAEYIFTSERDEISGSFTDGTNALAGTVDVAAGQAHTAYLLLNGKPTEELSETKIGTVTVRIGGDSNG